MTTNSGSSTAPPVEPVQQIGAVATKIPPFWIANPELWFIRVEAILSLQGITREETKFNRLTAELDEPLMELIKDILTSTTIPAKYEAAKTRLIAHYQDSEEKKIRKLLGGLQIGDLKPSHFLIKIKNLGGEQVNENIMKSIFLDQLSDQTKTILSISEIEDLSKLAEQADKIHEITTPQVSAVTVSMESSIMEKLNSLQHQIEELRLNRSRSRQPDNYNNRRRSRSKSKVNKEICWYHNKFGSNATKCTQPCKFTPKN